MNKDNLDKLATYLESLPIHYAHFDMADFLERRRVTDMTKQEYIYARRNGGFDGCATAACAVGHGPAAGILVPPQYVDGVYVDWLGYSRNLFTSNAHEWDWLFGAKWVRVDNHHWGAAARIRYLLAGNEPPHGYNYRASIYRCYDKRFQ